MTNIKLRLLIISLCLGCILPLGAVSFENVSFGSSRNVCALGSDPEGILWVGTEEGLYSYDGYRARAHFKMNDAGNTRVHSLYIAGKTIYLGTDAGLLVFDIQKNRYLPLPGNSPRVVRAVSKYGGEILLGAADGLYIYRPASGMIKRTANIKQAVYSICATRNGVLVGTIQGMYLLNRGRSTLIPVTAGQQPLVNALAYDERRDCVWIGTEGTLLQRKGNVNTEITGLRGNSVKALLAAPDSTLYVGTDNGLYAYHPNRQLEHFVHDIRSSRSLANNIVWALSGDQWQNVWVGTDNGLSFVRHEDFYKYISLNELTGKGAGNCLHAILAEPGQALWLGGTNGLIRHQGSSVWFRQFDKAYPLSHNRVRKIYRDRDGDILICTDHGINFYDRNRKQLRNFIITDSTGNFSTAWAYDIVEDAEGRYWIGSYMGGIAVIGKKRLLESDGYIVAERYFTTELTDVHVGQLVIDAMDRVWIGMHDKGLDRIDTRTMKVTHITKNSGYVYVMNGNSRDEILINYQDTIRRINIKSGHTALYPLGTQGGRTLSMVCAGPQLWIVTDGKCRVFDRKGEGVSFLLPDFQPYASWYDAKSRQVFLGGNDGYMVLPAPLEKSDRYALLRLTDLQVNGRSYGAGSVDVRFLESLRLRYNENNVELRFSDLPFRGEPCLEYAYKMDGVDYDWHTMPFGKPAVSYNGLPPGSYHLKVYTLNATGKTSREVYSLHITILPPWYLTWWAKCIYLLLLAGLLLWGFRYYMVKKRLREEQQARAMSLEQSHVRMKFFERLSHDLKNPLSEMVGQLYLLLKNDHNEELEQIRRSAEDIGQRIEQALELKLETQMLPSVKRETAETADDRMLKEIIRLIDENMSGSDFNVTRLQELLGIGSKQLYRKVKQLTGHTPVEFIRDMRMKKASLLLSEGKFSVSEVMYIVGFSNSGYFSKCFLQAHGITPANYSQRMKLQNSNNT